MRILKHKKNAAGQTAVKCIHYNNGILNETCSLDFINKNILCPCKVRYGRICNDYEESL